MSRSRSSFDLSGAIATATSLSTAVPEEQPAAFYRSVPLVSFGPTAAGLPTIMPPDSSETPEAELPPDALAPAPVPMRETHAAEDAGQAEGTRRPPKLPDLSEIKNPLLRCERIIEWITEAVGVLNVFIADSSGLPIAGDLVDGEARVAATGVVTAAVAHLASSIPGNSSTLFEMHVGEGPFFQVIGFDVGGASYVVGFQRSTPLGFRQAHAVRLACRHALDYDATANGPARARSGSASSSVPAKASNKPPSKPSNRASSGGDA